MKTALELLGTDFESEATVLASDTKPVGAKAWQLTTEQLERFARRAREEAALSMQERAAEDGYEQALVWEGDKTLAEQVAAGIRELPLLDADEPSVPPDRLRAALFQAISDMPPDASSGQIADAVLVRFDLSVKR